VSSWDVVGIRLLFKNFTLSRSETRIKVVQEVKEEYLFHQRRQINNRENLLYEALC